METLMIFLTNALLGTGLILIIAVALIRLTDGTRESIVERSALWSMAVGAFFQLTTINSPVGTRLDKILLICGMAVWLSMHLYDYVIRNRTLR